MTAIPDNRKIRKEQIKGVVKSIQAGTNVTVDVTDPENPVVSTSTESGITQTSGTYTPILKGGSTDIVILFGSPVLEGRWTRTGTVGTLSIFIGFPTTPGFTGSGIMSFTLPDDLFEAGEEIDDRFVSFSVFEGLDTSLVSYRSPYYAVKHATENWLQMIATNEASGVNTFPEPILWDDVYNGESGNFRININATFQIITL